MLVCALLVAALAGQPAWGDGNRGDDGSAAADRATQQRQGPALPAPPIVAAQRMPDPTPAPADEPRPVAVPSLPAQPEQGAENSAAPAMPVPAPATAAPAPAEPESSRRPSVEEPASGAGASGSAPAQKETPDTSSGFAPPTKVAPATAITTSSQAPPPALPPADTWIGTGTEDPPSAGSDVVDPQTGDASDPSSARSDARRGVPGGALRGPQPTGRPIQDGPVLQQPAREITQAPSGTRTSTPDNGGALGIGKLSEPSSAGIKLATNLLKDIPAWITVALAGLGALVLLLGAYTVLAAARTRRLERQRLKLMEDIGLLQAALLPAVPGRLGTLLTTVAYRPADGPGAGGDFYDAFALSDGRVGLLLGDISGHGRQALAKTTLVRFTVRAHLEAGLSPREAIAISGRSLEGRLSNDFATVIAAIHDPVVGTLTYASAGHPPPLVLGPQAHEPVTASSAPPIGAGFPTGQRQTVLPMPEGSTVAVYSDGLLEARLGGEGLGRERLGDWLQELGPEATAKGLLDLVVQRADRVPDDLAAVILHAAPGATAPATRVEQLKLDVLDTDGPELDGFLMANGVSRADRALTARRVTEQLTVSGGVVVEIRVGEHPTVGLASIGDRAPGLARPSSRAR